MATTIGSGISTSHIYQNPTTTCAPVNWNTPVCGPQQPSQNQEEMQMLQEMMQLLEEFMGGGGGGCGSVGGPSGILPVSPQQIYQEGYQAGLEANNPDDHMSQMYQQPPPYANTPEYKAGYAAGEAAYSNQTAFENNSKNAGLTGIIAGSGGGTVPPGAGSITPLQPSPTFQGLPNLFGSENLDLQAAENGSRAIDNAIA